MRDSCRYLVDFLICRYCRALEIGIGHCSDVARALKRSGLMVFATDIVHVEHEGLDVLFDDVTKPDHSLYRGIDAVYAIRPPPELVAYMRRLAKILRADLIVKPLSTDHLDGPLIGYGKETFIFWSFP